MTEQNSPVAAPPSLAAVDHYVEFWNAETAYEQQRSAARAFSTGVSYHAPVGVLRGPNELIDFRDRFAQHSPDYVFRPRTEPVGHHDRARVQWELVVDGKTFATGTDVLELDQDGRIGSITAFLDRAPEGFAAQSE